MLIRSWLQSYDIGVTTVMPPWLRNFIIQNSTLAQPIHPQAIALINQARQNPSPQYLPSQSPPIQPGPAPSAPPAPLDLRPTQAPHLQGYRPIPPQVLAQLHQLRSTQNGPAPLAPPAPLDLRLAQARPLQGYRPVPPQVLSRPRLRSTQNGPAQAFAAQDPPAQAHPVSIQYGSESLARDEDDENEKS